MAPKSTQIVLLAPARLSLHGRLILIDHWLIAFEVDCYQKGPMRLPGRWQKSDGSKLATGAIVRLHGFCLRELVKAQHLFWRPKMHVTHRFRS